MIQFQVRMVYFAAAFDKNGLVALSGVEQGQGEDELLSALYAVADLNTGKIVWQSQQKTIDFSEQVFLSPDEKQMWARTSNGKSDLVFDMANGKLSVAPENQFPTFSPDGKRFIRLTDYGNRGQKPNLKTAQIWER